MDFIWENPPEHSRGQAVDGAMKYQREAEEMRKHPGKWMRLELLPYPTNSFHGRVGSVKAGNYAAFRPPEHWEIIVRQKLYFPGKKYMGVWMRYVGEKDDN